MPEHIGLAELPAVGPQEAHGAVDGVYYTPAGFIQQRSEDSRAKMIRPDVDEIHESNTAIELGKEHSSVALRLRVLNPLKTWPYIAILFFQ
ncbi:hypothetical protein AMTR_s00037p00097870 [Amborella trichopoda]|uniref:Uncharacterized protein n=1 Tax=Amborella trichopoda TaxID=13333 RepID=U5D4E8_AMBTC|nr:hypothetical protein AMTR_s00037p00097870 [Amborella trichopoda]